MSKEKSNSFLGIDETSWISGIIIGGVIGEYTLGALFGTLIGMPIGIAACELTHRGAQRLDDISHAKKGSQRFNQQ